ncbi:MAG: hypothetical protein Q9213_002619 [Squamulea squamosa]
MSTETPNQPSTSLYKRKAPSPPNNPLDETDPIDAKKSKMDPSLQTMSAPSLSSASPPNLSSTSFTIPSASTPLPPTLPTRPRSPTTTRFSPPPLAQPPQPMLKRSRFKRPSFPMPFSAAATAAAATTFAREATRLAAATHLKRAREDLVESIRISGLNRQIILAEPSASSDHPITEMPPPPPSPFPPPSPPMQDSDDDEYEDHEETSGFVNFDFVGYGRGKQDGECKKGKGDGEKEGLEKSEHIVLNGTESELEKRKLWADGVAWEEVRGELEVRKEKERLEGPEKEVVAEGHEKAGVGAVVVI